MVAYSQSVFDTFINNYNHYIAAAATVTFSEDDESGLTEALSNKLMTSEFVCDLLFLNDICQILASCSKQVQLSGLLPWEYPVYVSDLKSDLHTMLEQIENFRD